MYKILLTLQELFSIFQKLVRKINMENCPEVQGNL